MKKLALLTLLLPTLALAARDASGNYTLPAGNPVVAGTKITSTWANGTMNDIAAALTDSLSRSGKGGMTVPFYLSDGTKASPGLSFTSEQNSGWYRNTTGDLRLSVQGADALSVTASTIYFGQNTTRYRIPTWFDAVLFFPGKMINNQLLARVAITSSSRFLATLPGTVSFAGATPTGGVAITVKKKVGTNAATNIGTISWLAGQSQHSSISFAADVDFAAGDFIEFWGPATADATFADVSITLQGRRL